MGLKASDLRLGNLVYCPEMGTQDYVSPMHINRLKNEDRGAYEAIPLTPEWLEKFGYKQLGEGMLYYKEFGTNSWIRYYQGRMNYKTGKNGQMIGQTLKYVHQLQNLYFALCGEELTIKKKETTT